MAAMGLPGTDLNQLRRQAKDWLRRGRSGDPEALALLRQLHPRGEELAADPSRLRLADAQLALARAYDFASWPKLREHLRMVEPWRRNPHRLGERTDPADELLRLACLTYGADDGVRPSRAAAMLDANPELAGTSIFTAAATGSVSHLRRFLADDPVAALAEGGPHQWTPLLYLCFSRIPDAPPKRSSLACAGRLLDAGADPNDGFLWEGLAPPFTALTGAFGGGEDRANQPPHQHANALARMLLDAGADPNDGQTLYNRMFEASNEHLHLLFEYGLGRGSGGPWRARLGERQQRPAEMLADQLIWAVESGRADRVSLLLEIGADPNHPGSGHPTHEGRSAYEWALRTGSTETAAALLAAGARPPDSGLDPVDQVVAAALAGEAETVRRSDPELLAQARLRRPGAVDVAVELRRPAAVRLLVEAGFSVHGDGGTTPLHLVAYEGNLELARLLVTLGADPDRTDPAFGSTPVGWAEHAHHDAMADYLRSVSSARPRSAAPPGPADPD
jgi:hypothetical protein